MAKILIVDGDHKSAKAMAKALTDAGHTCAVRHRGRDALEMIDKEALDLVLIDTMLPDVSGFSVCRNVRRSSELFHLPIVFISIMSSPEEVQHGLAQGADDFIPKPIDLGQMLQRVNSMLNASARASHLDATTGLPDAEETRRRMQLRISRGDRFALVYVELLGLRRLMQEAGADGRDKALRHLGRALRLSLESAAESDGFVGHMGGGFFLCMMPPDRVDVYASKLLKSWRKHQPGLRENLGIREPAMEGPSDYLDLMICTTARETRDPCSAQELLDTLSRIRRSVRDEVGGIHIDRRHNTTAADIPGERSGV